MTGLTPAAIDAALSLADAADDVIATCDQGDLAAAIQTLHEALKQFDDLRRLGAFAKIAPIVPGWRFEAALYIVDPGACNPSGIAHALIEACRQARDEGSATTRDPAIRLMVTQLAWICDASADTPDYGKLLAECRRLVAAESHPASEPTPTTTSGPASPKEGGVS